VGLCDCVGGLEMSLLSVPGCWLLVAGCWLLVAGCWLLVAGCWLLKMLYEDEFEIGIHNALHAPIIKA
jgi:hypothetical protein